MQAVQRVMGAPSQDEIRRQNLSALLRLVHQHGQMSRSQLTTELGLNRSTIGALTAELTDAGLVAEEAPRETGRAGRPSPVVRPRSEAVYVYAASIEAGQVRAARIGLGGQILARTASSLPATALVPAIGALIKDLAPSGEPASGHCAGLGLAVSNSLAAVDGPLAASLGDRLAQDLPELPLVTVGAIADLCALAEHTRGVAVGCSDSLYIYGDVGVEAGIVTGGQRVIGHGGYGGKVGHMVVNPQGQRCGCGSRGCWETEIGEAALLRLAEAAGSGHEEVLIVLDRAARGDSVAQAAVRRVGDWLGFGVANLVNIFNPEIVMFGGTLRDIYLAAAAQVRSKLNAMTLTEPREQVRLRTPELGDDAALFGAAELAFAPLLADPLG